MSLWPILPQRRREHAAESPRPAPPPPTPGPGWSTPGGFEHSAVLIARQTCDVTGAASAIIFRLDAAADCLRALAAATDRDTFTAPDLTCACADGLVGRAVREGRVVWTGNALEDRRAGAYWRTHPALFGSGCRAAMAAPLLVSGQLFGVLQVGYPSMRTFRANELSEFGKLAMFAATTLENARLHDVTVRSARQLRLLHDVAAELTVAADPAEIALRVASAARDLVSARSGRLWLCDEDTGAWRLAAAQDDPAATDAVLGQPLAGHRDMVAISAAGIVLASPARGPDAPASVPWRRPDIPETAPRQPGLRCVPLTRGDATNGVLVLEGVSTVWDTDDADVLGALAAQASVALTNARLYARQAAAAAEQARLHEQALELGRLKSELLANVSHEIRTPMNGVIGMASVLLDSDLTDEQRDTTETIRASAGALLSLINDLLDFAKMEAGRMTLDLANFSPRAVVDDVVDLLAEQARGRGLDLCVQVDADVPSVVRGDAMRLRQVLVNLVGNALKFTDRGGVQLRMRRADRAAGTLLHVEVVDTGVGIQPEDMPRLFEAFSQVDGTAQRRHGGTGLGLAICRQIVELMGGEIGVESEPGIGSTFWFTARVGEAITEPPAGAGAASAATPPASAQASRILVVEDNLINQKVLMRLLHQRGHFADIAETGAAAVRAVQQTPYDAVLMDCQMPDMDGFQATEAIRRWEQTEHDAAVLAGRPAPRRLPIVAVTASATTGDRDRCLAVGMDDFLPKPIDVAALDRLMGRWLGAVTHPS